ncbi:MAG TPA: glycerophosphodiester phosphodiesterase [Burkholderiaceae bacterium]|nr:glycerophosphodiester phosphodiesterase [Burkholderiaceae bacterium]
MSSTPLWPYPRILAHRGGGTLAPENTLAALRTGRAHGHRAVEFDVMLTRDGVPVLMHDPHFGRTIAGKGLVAQTLFSELKQRDAGRWFSAEFANDIVPSLRDAIDFCRAHGLWMNIEIKPSSDDMAHETGRVVGKLVREVFAREIEQASGGLDPALPEFSSFSMDALAGARATCEAVPRGLLVTKIPNDWFDQMKNVNALALHACHRELNRDLVSEVRSRGVPLMVYTVNDPERARLLFAWGVDAVCTDRIDLINATFI